MKHSLILLISIFHITIHSSTDRRLSEGQLTKKTTDTPLMSPDYSGLSTSNSSFGLSSESPKTENALRDLQNKLAIVKAALISREIKDHSSNAQRIASQEKRARRGLLQTFENMKRASVQRKNAPTGVILNSYFKQKQELSKNI